jgi:dCTP deaminase
MMVPVCFLSEYENDYDMCVLGANELVELVRKYKVIHPFDPSLLDGDGYILTVREDVMLQYLEHKNIVSREIVFVPPDYIALLTAKSKYGREGLCFLNASKAHSFWVGRLSLELVNLSNERKPIVIKKGNPFMHLIFIERKGKAVPYRGPYQFQFMTEEEVSMYIQIMTKFFPDILDEAVLREMARTRVLS